MTRTETVWYLTYGLVMVTSCIAAWFLVADDRMIDAIMIVAMALIAVGVSASSHDEGDMYVNEDASW